MVWVKIGKYRKTVLQKYAPYALIISAVILLAFSPFVYIYDYSRFFSTISGLYLFENQQVFFIYTLIVTSILSVLVLLVFYTGRSNLFPATLTLVIYFVYYSVLFSMFTYRAGTIGEGVHLGSTRYIVASGRLDPVLEYHVFPSDLIFSSICLIITGMSTQGIDLMRGIVSFRLFLHLFDLIVLYLLLTLLFKKNMTKAVFPALLVVMSTYSYMLGSYSPMYFAVAITNLIWYFLLKRGLESLKSVSLIILATLFFSVVTTNFVTTFTLILSLIGIAAMSKLIRFRWNSNAGKILVIMLLIASTWWFYVAFAFFEANFRTLGSTLSSHIDIFLRLLRINAGVGGGPSLPQDLLVVILRRYRLVLTLFITVFGFVEPILLLFRGIFKKKIDPLSASLSGILFGTWIVPLFLGVDFLTRVDLFSRSFLVFFTICTLYKSHRFLRTKRFGKLFNLKRSIKMFSFAVSVFLLIASSFLLNNINFPPSALSDGFMCVTLFFDKYDNGHVYIGAGMTFYENLYYIKPLRAQTEYSPHPSYLDSWNFKLLMSRFENVPSFYNGEIIVYSKADEVAMYQLFGVKPETTWSKSYASAFEDRELYLAYNSRNNLMFCNCSFPL